MLLAYHPRNAYWAQALDQVQQGARFAQRLLLDVYRLRRTVGVLTRADDFMTMAELSIVAGYPAEARRVLDEGFLRNILGGISPEGVEHGRMRGAASRLAREEERRTQREATSQDGNVLASVGFALALDEQSERSVALLEKAVVKSGLDSPDDVRFRLGLAQLWAGHRRNAERTLRAIRSQDGTQELVRLWLLVADNVK